MRHAAALGTFLVALMSPGPLGAAGLVADLSPGTISITSSFTGTEITLFGTVERDPFELLDLLSRHDRRPSTAETASRGDIIVVLRGPPEEVAVRRKAHVGGVLWMNVDTVAFIDVPGFYYLASTRPLEDIASPAVLQRGEFGMSNIQLKPKTDAESPALTPYRQALVRNKARQGLYIESIGGVSFRGSLFSATVRIPANVPDGRYSAEVFLLRDGAVASAQSWLLLAEKSGFERWVFRLAHQEPVAYGTLAIVLALAAGAVASALTRTT
jgi:uncharacterized protein (TIGR02186 family)